MNELYVHLLLFQQFHGVILHVKNLLILVLQFVLFLTLFMFLKEIFDLTYLRDHLVLHNHFINNLIRFLRLNQ
jgi:hypothetical protein